MLSIASPLRSQTLKHNVIDRDKVLVPPHWDSWGKIRVLREGFDVEGINLGWSADIAPSSEPEGSEAGDLEGNGEGGGATEVYEDVIKDTGRQNDHMALLKGRTMEVMPVDTQEFLASQLETLEQKAQEDRGVKGKKGMAGVEEQDGALQEQVGPVQFNVGGIQVDAENMLESLKVCFDLPLGYPLRFGVGKRREMKTRIEMGIV